MHDHMCCVALFSAAVISIGSIVYYYKSRLSLARKDNNKD